MGDRLDDIIDFAIAAVLIVGLPLGVAYELNRTFRQPGEPSRNSIIQTANPAEYSTNAPTYLANSKL